MRTLAAGKLVVTVLLNPVARILDVLVVFNDGPALSVLTLPRRSTKTFNFLKSRIFFMDKVTVEDLSAAYTQIDLDGTQAAGVLQRCGLPTPPALHTLQEFEMAGALLRVLALKGIAGTAYRLLCPNQAQADLLAVLAKAGAAPIEASAYEILRVEAGLPACDSELGEEYTPLETGLGYAISSTKGCYTGQEVIARQVNYDKITQHLVGLRLPAPVAAGAHLSVDGKPVGNLTSSVISPIYGPIALAIVRRPHHEPGSLVEIETPQGKLQATVCLIPFSN